MKSHHLVILKKPYLDAILAGKKTVESRFTKKRRYWFGRVNIGDRLFLKLSSGPVCATTVVADVKYFENLTSEKMLRLKSKYNNLIGGADGYWKSKTDCKFGLLVWLGDVQPIEHVKINKKDWRAWVVLTKQWNFGLLKNCHISCC